jgi:hypothetical protein
MSMRRRVDLVAVTAAGLILITTVNYLFFSKSLMAGQGFALLIEVPRGMASYWAAFMNRMPFWNTAAFSILLAGTGLAIYGAILISPYRRIALALAGLILTWLGIVAISSLGVPIILAGLLCLAAASRRDRPIRNA